MNTIEPFNGLKNGSPASKRSSYNFLRNRCILPYISFDSSFNSSGTYSGSNVASCFTQQCLIISENTGRNSSSKLITSDTCLGVMQWIISSSVALFASSNTSNVKYSIIAATPMITSMVAFNGSHTVCKMDQINSGENFNPHMSVKEAVLSVLLTYLAIALSI